MSPPHTDAGATPNGAADRSPTGTGSVSAPPPSPEPSLPPPPSPKSGRSGSVYRIVWVPGTDRLRGWCWCGAAHETDGPAELWDWLLRHPGEHHDSDGHQDGDGPAPTATPATTPPAAIPVPAG